MKFVLIVIFMTTVLLSCRLSDKKESLNNNITKSVNYPENLLKILKAHGGLTNWKNAKTLVFYLKDEKHTVELSSRKTVVRSNNYSLGFDGNQVWLLQKDSATFKRKPEFYYNLYFYFYAMPFVLADNGIEYSNTPSITFQGESYPGIKISYQNGIGSTPDDNYYLYFHPKTYQMQWLGYTATYNSKKTTLKPKLIRYNNWEHTQGLLLPKLITWYQSDERGNPKKATEKQLNFLHAQISKQTLDSSFFKKPLQ
ncbi:MAG: DUF6503 family protein [Tenacibaculum sp.]